MQDRVAPLPALTGLRFVAALLIVLGHMVPLVMPCKAPPTLLAQIPNLSAEAMSIFFVLSGFIIHYNYSDAFEKEWLQTLRNFWIARVARLYPLYVVLIGYQMLYSYSYSNLAPTAWSVLPSYLLFLQSWFYWPVGNTGLIYEMGFLSLSWSISTDWFCYVCYPLIWLVLTKIKSIRGLITLAVCMSIVVLTAVFTASLNEDLLNQLGASWFGSLKDATLQAQYTFFRWLLYFSPYSRIFEFILGCICGALFLSIRGKEVSDKEERIGRAVLIAVIFATLVHHWFIFIFSQRLEHPKLISNFHLSYGFAPLTAIIIFCCARYKSKVSSVLSSWPMVLCGSATYSLYLLHIFTIMAFRWESAQITNFIVGVGDFLRLIIALLSTIGLSLVTWGILEEPARKWIRNLLTAPGKTAI